MNSLIIYDSQFGNTRKVAEEIAGTLKGKAIYVKDFKKNMLKSLNLLVVGSPIQAWRPTKQISDFLSSLPTGCLKGIKVTAFDTRVKIFFSGDAAGKINVALEKLGGEIVSTPQKYYVKGKEGPLVEGELDNARNWAKKIQNK
jgi:flavodoxin